MVKKKATATSKSTASTAPAVTSDETDIVSDTTEVISEDTEKPTIKKLTAAQQSAVNDLATQIYVQAVSSQSGVGRKLEHMVNKAYKAAEAFVRGPYNEE